MTDDSKQAKEPRRCYGCNHVVVFDASQKSPRGILIPLDPDTGRPHDCPSENGKRGKLEAQAKEKTQVVVTKKEPEDKDHYTLEQRERLEQISRLTHSVGRLKIFSGEAAAVERLYNDYRYEIAKFGAKIDGCPSKVTSHGNEVLFSIFVYFEIPKEFAREVDAIK
jgi:hypothetical protein